MESGGNHRSLRRHRQHKRGSYRDARQALEPRELRRALRLESRTARLKRPPRDRIEASATVRLGELMEPSR